MKTDEPAATSPAAVVPACWPVALALFATVFFGRAWMIRTWGSPVPTWDEWNATALQLFRPWLDGSLGWRDLLAAHNEHRIALTRLADLAWFSLLGRWDPWWQMLFNAALHAGTAVTLLGFCWKHLTPAARSIVALSLALLFSMLSGWQNALWGFQSQFYFCNLLSVFALGGLLLGRPWGMHWLLGCGAALLALFSTGGGVLAAATVLVLGCLLLAWDGLLRRRPIDGKSTASLGCVFLIVLLGWMLRVEVDAHAPLRAHSVAQFCAVFFRCLSWPWIDSPWLWPAMLAPVLGLAGDLIRRRASPAPWERIVLGLVLLTLLHAAAIAYSRGSSLPESRPLSRYQDVQLLSMAANLIAVLLLGARHRIVRTGALIWGGLCVAGMMTLTTENISRNLILKRAQGVAGLSQARAYLATKDVRTLYPETIAFRLHPDPAVVQKVLDDPLLQPRLPREFFDQTITPPRVITQAPWLTLVSLGGLLLLTLRRQKPEPPSPVQP